MDDFIAQMGVVGEKANIVLEMKTERMGLIDESKYWYGFIEAQKIDDQTSRLWFANNELRGFANWIISSGSYARVEEPSELKESVNQIVSGIVENYR